MRFHRYLGCVYDIFFEEINVRFLVHKSLIDNETRDLILFYIMTGNLPPEITVMSEENVFRFAPNSKDIEEEISERDYLWFAL
ncbi:hypothetical protein MASR2M70_10940 [Bacillota bacterium]